MHDTVVFKEITVADGSQIGGVRSGKKHKCRRPHTSVTPVIIIKCFPRDIRDGELNSETQRSQRQGNFLHTSNSIRHYSDASSESLPSIDIATIYLYHLQ